MSNVPAVSMEDLELEHAELLPSRETLWALPPEPRLELQLHPGGRGNGNTNSGRRPEPLRGERQLQQYILNLGSGNII